jgi:hypothetical protein
VGYLARWAHGARGNSAALRLALPRINLQVKAWGVILPGSEFAHLTQRAYVPSYAGWQAARRELLELGELAKTRGVSLQVVVLPPLRETDAAHFADAQRFLAQQFRALELAATFPDREFRGYGRDELVISPFDTHPNAKANRLMADVTAEPVATALEPRAHDNGSPSVD